MKAMNIVCVGAGSIGMLAAAKLAAAGADVALVARTERQAALLNGEGLALRQGDTETVCRVPAYSFERLAEDRLPERLEGADWIMLTVKQQHLSEPLLALLGAMAAGNGGGRLLCFQNGIGHAERLSRFVHPSRLFLAVTTEGAKKLSGREVAHTGAGSTWIGPAFGNDEPGTASPEIDNAQKKAVKTLNEAGFRTFPSNQMMEIVWNKLLINAVVNPLTALLRVRNGELLATERRIGLMRRLLDEGTAVAKACGIPVRDDVWEQIVDVCAKTADNASSMLQDVSSGRPTEIDWINGAIVERARRFGIPVPVHETVCDLVKASVPESGQTGGPLSP
ncbi:ketopantoate reductase family protein [Paenibacillus flagellatus]|uniref:2-dehydropantoate 2-reductase n=1 Tax=Paenibacillus flagellatus TaxID=2211139 RepID=A0A2V5K5N1_9BACL|nr:2-dehydropantoate 2-reductase [Paenibacillus flagellatus]PYI54598.1 2-dehydropantoate 2-reductase [Paenibacillus flagellatus]